MGSGQSSQAYEVTTRKDEVLHHNIFECKFDWTVANFEGLKYNAGQHVTSQRLKMDINGTTDEWEIVLYPSGYNERTADALSVWLRRVSTSERLVQFTCTISSEKHPKYKEKKAFVKTVKQKLSLESVLGWSVFCKRSDILSESNGILRDGNLTLGCVVEVFDDKCLPHPAVEDDESLVAKMKSELSEDFHQLLKSKIPGDTTFEINGELIHSHKAILGARSKVFMKMFDFESDKDLKNIVIEDISKDTFISMLEFIYSGKHSKVDFDTLKELYYAADKYELLSLWKICSSILSNSLTTDNAVQVLVLANRHGDVILQEACIEFIARNAPVVQKREDWLNMMKTSPILANAVFQSLANVNEKNKLSDQK